MTPAAYRFARRLEALCRDVLREPASMEWDGSAYGAIFDPPLTIEEQALYADLLAIARGSLTIDPDDYAAFKAVLPEMRTLRTRTDAQWTAMTATQRDTALIGWCRDLTDVLRALLRDA